MSDTPDALVNPRAEERAVALARGDLDEAVSRLESGLTLEQAEMRGRPDATERSGHDLAIRARAGRRSG
jgi:hypothetical protein